MIVSILCGGSGNRLWPLSRELMPKQFVKFIGNTSLFQQTIARNKDIGDKFFIITNKSHYFIAQDELMELNINKKIMYLLESDTKNTAASMLMLALSVGKDEIILSLPSDHIIKDIESYKNSISLAKSIAQENYIVLFGIKPNTPCIGYGYIKDDNKKVSFFEKPTFKKAKEYIKDNNYYWNSGIFCFKASTLINEFDLYNPKMLKECKKIIKAASYNNDFIVIKQMDNLENISIDYAIMEKSNKLKMLKADFYWSDVGSFDSLKNEYFIDSNNNATNTNLITLDSKNNLVLSNKLVATIGINDLIVVDSEDSILIAKSGESEKVKDIVKIIKDSNSELCKVHKTVYRPWGMYSILLEGNNYKIKQIVVKPNKRLSLQKHFHRNEHWVVVNGSAIITIEDKEFILRTNESTYISMGNKHRLHNPGKIDLVIIEIQVGQYLKEDDIIRLEDDYNRE